ncbi:MAG: hypothetical protein EP343_18575 [Deltaproteobacteria bacterium]|nr:MAG: hypothetical protein EP343_18575 [Deltaproteobacteria bacterium]
MGEETTTRTPTPTAIRTPTPMTTTPTPMVIPTTTKAWWSARPERLVSKSATATFGPVSCCWFTLQPSPAWSWASARMSLVARSSAAPSWPSRL